MSWLQWHEMSEQLASDAEQLRGVKPRTARALYASAAIAERQALGETSADQARTRAATVVSAAALWYKAGDYGQAEALVRAQLELQALPESSTIALRALLRAVHREHTGTAGGPQVQPPP